MKKTAVVFLTVLAAVGFLRGTCHAAEEGEVIDTRTLSESVPESAREILGDISVSGDLDTDGALKKILNKILDVLESVMADTVRSAAILVVVSMLCALAGTMYPEKTEGPDYVTIVGALAIGSVVIYGSGSIVALALETMDEIHAFSASLLPTIAASSAAAGAVTSSAAKYAASLFFMELLMSLGKKLITPLIYTYLIAEVASAAFGGNIKSASSLIKKIIKTVLSLMAVSFTAYLTVSGVIASTADAATVKLTKTAISTLLPVIGGMVSDAADAVASGAMVVRNAVGAFGIIVVCAICAVPFLKLVAGMMLHKAAGALSEAVAGDRISGLISAVGTAYSMALALCGTSAIMLFISAISAIKAVSG